MGGRRENFQILRALSPTYAGQNGELTATLQYVYQSVLLDGCGRGSEAKKLLKIAVDEMRHLETIGGLLVKLGVPPVFTACPPYPVAYYSASNVNYCRKYTEMLDADIRGEKDAIACYTRILGTVRDDGVREAIEKIRADEERHLSILKEMRAAAGDSPQPPQGSRA